MLKSPYRFVVQPILDYDWRSSGRIRTARSRCCCQSWSNGNGINIFFTTSAPGFSPLDCWRRASTDRDRQCALVFTQAAMNMSIEFFIPIKRPFRFIR